MKICMCQISNWLFSTCSAQNFQMPSAMHCISLLSGTISSCIMPHPIILNHVTILLSSPLGIHNTGNVKEIKIYPVEELMKWNLKTPHRYLSVNQFSKCRLHNHFSFLGCYTLISISCSLLSTRMMQRDPTEGETLHKNPKTSQQELKD